jgi:predicted aldo/keto reductase-like oxidoreductase
MDYTTLGNTGMKVSVAGLGCGGFSQLGLAQGKSEADAIAIIRRAIEFGVNLFDTAYCLTGECSRDVRRCLTKHAPVASLSCGRAAAPLPFHKSMLTDVGPVELWATR